MTLVGAPGAERTEKTEPLGEGGGGRCCVERESLFGPPPGCNRDGCG